MAEVKWRQRQAQATTAQWEAWNGIPLKGEICQHRNANGALIRQKTGDGVTHHNDLPYDFEEDANAVQSVTGDPVDNTDPLNPVINAPTTTQFNEFVGDVSAALAETQPLNDNLTEIAAIDFLVGVGEWIYNEGGVLVKKSTEEVRKLLRSGRLLSNPYVNAGNTGNTNENIIGTIILVPAGTIEANDGLRMWGKIQAGAANAKTFRTYVNTTPNLTGTPVQILAWTVTNSLTVPFVRNYTQRGLINSMSGLNIGSPGTTSDEANTAINNSNFTVDWSVDQYIIRTMQNANGADNMVLLQHFIQLLKSP